MVSASAELHRYILANPAQDEHEHEGTRDRPEDVNIVELLFGILFTGMALWGVVGGEIYVLAGKASAGEGGWASFGDHPVIFLVAFFLYLLSGVVLIRGGLKGDK
ncbi:hypothetical protein QWY84_07850 [Aquisalimonas lutea]|uniref:hypothetical protein n=1 Tax=Aquisalimonas lutea TaxID=1327750 RepID=UPI0025B5961F|nr:hypothetical protein [Aquisalimonas lutea]MDN3517517.1 hypothetical protein [Aquisalimonas lutea]